MAVGGSVAGTMLAGCAAVGDAFASEEYEEGDEEQMYPKVSGDWPDSNLKEEDHDHWGRMFVNEDDDIVVLMDIEVLESVDEAEDRFKRAEARAPSPEDYPLADEALISDDGELASVGFRHSNAFGQVGSGRMSGFEVQPDRGRAGRYAELMYEHWQSL